jgi:hypothetical protein
VHFPVFLPNPQTPSALVENWELGMAGRSRSGGRERPSGQGQEEIWADAYNNLKQLADIHAKAQKLAVEANKNQRMLQALPNGEGLP